MPEVKEEVTLRKLRGGYYTPKPIADFLSQWAIQSNTQRVLEPSCGDGIFLDSAIDVFSNRGLSKKTIGDNIFAVEYNEIEAQKTKERVCGNGLDSNNIYSGDFFHYCLDKLSENFLFDTVLGNPPFIRYQNFHENQRIAAFAIMKRAGLQPNRLTNAWIPFLVASTLLLKNNGRLGMVIPAELFQVNYAAATRYFLSEMYSRITIVTFKKLVFKEVQQEVVLLLGERNGKENHGIKVVELEDANELATFNPDNLHSYELKLLDHSSEKWTQYFLTNKEIGLLRELKARKDLPVIGEFLKVDVGLVTGQNSFFVLTEKEVKEKKLQKYTKPIIGRTATLKGAILTKNDFKEISKSNQPSYLLTPPAESFENLPEELIDYISWGEENNINSGYKCRIRKEWWKVPSFWIPDAFMLRQVHCFPKVVLNKSEATSTDTIHRANFLNGTDRNSLAASFTNSLTFAFSEVIGRSYGGGVLTFEPSESEKLPLPIKNAEKIDLKKIDSLLREKKIDEVLVLTDDILLNKGLGLSKGEIALLNKIWKKMRDRRKNRI